MSGDPTMPLAVMQMIMGIGQGFADGSALSANADVADENARLALLDGELQAAQSYRDERQVSGEAIAAMASSGAVVGTGTAADIIRQNAIEAEIEVGNLRYRARAESRDLRQQALDLRRSAKAARVNGVMAGLSSGLAYMVTRDAQARVREQNDRERKDRLGRRDGGVKAGGRVPASKMGVIALTGGN